MLEDFRIRTIVNVGTLLLSASLVLTTVSHIMGARLGVRDMIHTSDNMLPSVAVLGKTTVNFELVRLRLARALMAEDLQQRDRALDAFRLAIRHVDQDLARFAPLVSDQRDAQLYGQILRQWASFKPAVEHVAQLCLQGQQGEAKRLFQTTIVRDAEAMQRTLDITTDYNIEEAKSYTANTVSEAIGAIRQSEALGFVGLLVGLFILSLFRRRVTHPLIKLERAMVEMAEGQLDIVIPGATKSDELGKIARALDGIKVSVTHRVERAADVQLALQRRVTASLEIALTALKAGNLHHRIEDEFPIEYGQLRGDFNAMVEALEGQLEEVASSADAVRGGAGEISAAALDLSTRTERQAASLGETALTVKALTTSVLQARASAVMAASAAREAEKEATQSGVQMEEAVAAMTSIAGTSDKMRNIVAIIDGISFQTNLLALNAGVEAARAGDAGRGFGVVASEVRSLAERSAQAAREIGELIVTSVHEVQHGVKMVSQTQAALLRIVKQTSDVSGMIGGLAEGSRQQADAIAQVNGVIADLDEATQYNAALVEETTAAASSLASESERLAQVVGRFTFGKGAGSSVSKRQPWAFTEPEGPSISSSLGVYRERELDVGPQARLIHHNVGG